MPHNDVLGKKKKIYIYVLRAPNHVELYAANTFENLVICFQVCKTYCLFFWGVGGGEGVAFLPVFFLFPSVFDYASSPQQDPDCGWYVEYGIHYKLTDSSSSSGFLQILLKLWHILSYISTEELQKIVDILKVATKCRRWDVAKDMYKMPFTIFILRFQLLHHFKP